MSPMARMHRRAGWLALVLLGASLVLPSSTFTQDGTGSETSTESPPGITPQVFVTAKINDLVSLGFGFHAPFGSRIEWPAAAKTFSPTDCVAAS